MPSRVPLHAPTELQPSAWLACAGGGWLSDAPVHTYHVWHATLARAYLEQRPDAAEALRGEAEARGIPAEKLLWERWYHGKQLHAEPLYTWSVALVYRLGGSDSRIVYGLQRTLARSTTASWLGFGVGLGLACLLKTIFAPFGVLALMGAGWERRAVLRGRLSSPGASG